MSSPALDADDEPSSNIPPFITPPPTNPVSRIPQVTQTQNPENEVNANPNTTTDDHHDTYIHYHDPGYIHQTPVCPQRISNIPIVPVVCSSNCANISGKEELAKSSKSNMKKRAAGKKQMSKMQKCQRQLLSCLQRTIFSSSYVLQSLNAFRKSIWILSPCGILKQQSVPQIITGVATAGTSFNLKPLIPLLLY